MTFTTEELTISAKATAIALNRQSATELVLEALLYRFTYNEQMSKAEEALLVEVQGVTNDVEAFLGTLINKLEAFEKSLVGMPFDSIAA